MCSTEASFRQFVNNQKLYVVLAAAQSQFAASTGQCVRAGPGGPAGQSRCCCCRPAICAHHRSIIKPSPAQMRWSNDFGVGGACVRTFNTLICVPIIDARTANGVHKMRAHVCLSWPSACRPNVTLPPSNYATRSLRVQCLIRQLAFGGSWTPWPWPGRVTAAIIKFKFARLPQ